MSQEKKELVVAKGGSWHVAEVGTEIPDDPIAALPGFTELGLLTEDGLKFNRSITIQEFKAWQKRPAVRREVTDEELMASGALEQWNADNFAFAFGGGEIVEVSSGLYKYEFPDADDALDERATVLRWQDGDRHYQLGFESGNVTEPVEVGLKRSELSTLGLGYKALAGDDETLGVSFVTDDPAFEPTGS